MRQELGHLYFVRLISFLSKNTVPLKKYVLEYFFYIPPFPCLKIHHPAMDKNGTNFPFRKKKPRCIFEEYQKRQVTLLMLFNLFNTDVITIALRKWHSDGVFS